MNIEKSEYLFNPILDRYAPWDDQPVRQREKRRVPYTAAEDAIILDNIHMGQRVVWNLLKEAGYPRACPENVGQRIHLLRIKNGLPSARLSIRKRVKI